MTETSQIIMVTGATGNVGRALVATLAARGHHVVAVDRNAAAIKESLVPLGGEARHMAVADLDLTDDSACTVAVQSALSRYGRIDGVAHTVGGFAAAGVDGAGPQMWQDMFVLNAITTLNVFRAAIPPMRALGGGSLLAIGATAGLKAPSGLSAYAAAKGAIHRMVESFADELKRDHIRVNAVLPSIIDTPQNRAAIPDADFSTWVHPKELAEAIAFLLARDASGITGALVPVTGRV